jgi:hypothetical protein
MHQTGWTALVADLIIDPPRSSRRLLFAEPAGSDQQSPITPTTADPAEPTARSRA